MKQSLRFFSLGLFVSALLLFGFNFFFGGSDSLSNATVDELEAALHEEGYRVVSEDDYITYTMKKEQTQNESEKDTKDTSKEKAKETNKKDKQDSEKEQDKDKKTDSKKKDEKDKNEEDEDKDKVVKASFKTKAGVVSPEIADTLIDKKIIKKNERDKFIKYMDSNGHSEYIQLGTFKVNSDMSYKEIADVVTTYPGD